MPSSSLSIRTVLLLTVGCLTLLITTIATREVVLQWQRWEEIQELKHAVHVSRRFFDTIEHLSREREITTAMLGAGDTTVVRNLRPHLQQSRAAADRALEDILFELQRSHPAALDAPVEALKTQYAYIQKLRRQVDQAGRKPLEERDGILSSRMFNQKTALIGQSYDLWMLYTRHFTRIDPVVTQRLMFQHFLGLIIRYSGRERALIGGLLVSNRPISSEEQALLLQWRGVIEQGWEMCDKLSTRSQLAPDITPYLEEAQSHYLTVYDMVHDLFYVPSHQPDSYPLSMELWLEVANGSNDSLNALKNAALAQTQAYADQLDREARRSMLLHGIVLVVALWLCLYSLLVINRRVVGPIRRMIDSMVVTAGLPPQVRQNDEIGQLEEVLHALQENMDAVHRYTTALERSNKELDDFAYIASHDLKEPLRGIHNHSRFLLEDNADKLDKESVERLNRLLFLTQRMEKLVNDLLYFSRLGRHELAVQPTDLNTVVHDIEATLADFLQERKAAILVPKPLPTVVCDKTRITEALRNLITNGVKYNDKAERTIEVGCLDNYIMPSGEKLARVFYVRDNGLGIPLEFHEEVFRIFKRLQSGGGAEEGTGVGLTFVKKIIERHGGKIWLTSEVGQGTTFYFTLGDLHEQTA